MRNFPVKCQESSIGFENLAHLQSIEKGDPFWPVKNWPVIFWPVTFGQLSYAN